MRRVSVCLWGLVAVASPLVRADDHDHEHDENKWPGTMTDAQISCVDNSVDECACTENGNHDGDCCAAAGEAGCIDGYRMTQLTDAGPCFPGTLAYSTCCEPIPNYFEDDLSGNGQRGLGTHQLKADGSSNEPSEWKLLRGNETSSTWCETENFYAEKKCNVFCMEQHIANHEGFLAAIWGIIIANLVLVVVVSIGCWGGGIYCMTQNKKQGYEPQPMIWLIACLLFWCGCWCFTFIPFACKNEKFFYDPPEKPQAPVAVATATAVPVATATAVANPVAN